MKNLFHDFATAFQFLTRLPLNWLEYRPGALARAAKFFPLVGLLIGATQAGIYVLLAPHLPLVVVAILVVLYSVFVTGGLHEDGLADVADAFGGGWNKLQTLAIMKDSRIGVYGALAILFSIMIRVFLLACLPVASVMPLLISAEVLSRWTILPLGAVLPDARANEEHPSGSVQAARIAHRISRTSLLFGTVLAFAIVGLFLHLSMWKPIVAAFSVLLLSGLYYKHRLNGVTGDCFGATVQLTTLAIYLCGAWIA